MPYDYDCAQETRAAGGSVVILIPLFDDWESFAELAPRLDEALALAGETADVLIVDDGSALEPVEDLGARPFRAIGQIDVLTLRRNLGHQRAIAVGLAFVEDRLAYDAVVVMDGDGEDRPEDVPRLLARLRDEGERKIVFAERARRSESLTFRVNYALYKLLHRVLIGQPVRVGNFSAIPRRRLESLVVVSELWNHYAAAAFHSRQPLCTIPTHRGRRLRGRSSMNFVRLVMHGLSAISVYSEILGVRLLVGAAALAMMALTGIAATVGIRLMTDLAIPGWATYTVGCLSIVLLQGVMLATTFSFVMLGGRHDAVFLPRRDYAFFVGRMRCLSQAADVTLESQTAGHG
ncbi:MAG: glycosyl transferase [Planctomycetota bacterium]|nr:glycosyl transferase [Planctomycetota bacterium]